MKHRVGFIGFGDMGGGYHFQVARDRKDVCDDLAPVAVCDLRPERRAFAEENGLKTYENVDEFLKNDEFDIVVVATPNNLHCEMTCKALEAGKHVICEKPVVRRQNVNVFCGLIVRSAVAHVCYVEPRRKINTIFFTSAEIQRSRASTPDYGMKQKYLYGG